MENEENFIKMTIGQQKYNSNKANICKKKLNQLRILQLTFSTLIPFTVAIFSDPECATILKYTVATLGLAVGIVEGLKNIRNYQDEWMNCRLTSEALKIELNHYQAKVSPYDRDDAFIKFVNRINNILKSSNSNWKTSTFDSEE